MMTKKELVRKNLDLLSEFMRYAFEHPEVLDQIPREARVIILPENDPVLRKENMQLVEESRRAGVPFVLFSMRVPEVPTLHLEEISGC